MTIGNHTENHHWLDTLSNSEQIKEIKESLEFLFNQNLIDDEWSFCHPYGSYNNNTISILKKLSCKLAYTTNPDINDLNIINCLKINRLDTNEFRKK